MSICERGPVRIHYEEAGDGFPLLVIPGGGLNATIAGMAGHVFNPLQEFSDGYRCVALDLRNATDGLSKGPLEVERPWGASLGTIPRERLLNTSKHHIFFRFVIVCWYVA